MKFRTKIEPVKSFPINYDSRLFLTGSCFANEIGACLEKAKFQTTVNPFGVLYNPASAARSIEILISDTRFESKDLSRFRERYFSFYHDTTFSSNSSEEALKKVNDSIKLGAERLRDADVLFVTFGTARIYRFKQSGQIVSNCHKLPAKDFEREMLSVDDIVKLWLDLIDRISAYSPSLKVVFTVSPVRHWKDGAHGNQLSKSILLIAIDELIRQREVVSYYPSYELLMDELRDYRFYADDLLHPSSKAIEYIWEHFRLSYFSDDTINLSNEIRSIADAVNHRILGINPEELKAFKSSMLKKIEAIDSKYPNIDFSSEKIYFKGLI